MLNQSGTQFLPARFIGEIAHSISFQQLQSSFERIQIHSAKLCLGGNISNRVETRRLLKKSSRANERARLREIQCLQDQVSERCVGTFDVHNVEPFV